MRVRNCFKIKFYQRATLIVECRHFGGFALISPPYSTFLPPTPQKQVAGELPTEKTQTADCKSVAAGVLELYLAMCL